MLVTEKPEPLISQDDNKMSKGQLTLLNYEAFALASLMIPRMASQNPWGKTKTVTRKYRKDRKRRNKIAAASRRRNKP
jgi:hypothetical protein